MEDLTDIQLLETTIDSDLTTVGSFIEKKIHKPIIITDHAAFIHYPKKSSANMQFITSLSDLLDTLTETQYIYKKNTATFIYPIGKGSKKAIIVIKNVDSAEIPLLLETLQITKLSIGYYMNLAHSIEKKFTMYKQNIIQNLFKKSDKSIQFLLAETNISLTTKNKYSILLMKIHETTIEPNILKTHLLKYCFKNNIEFVEPIFFNGYFVSILQEYSSVANTIFDQSPPCDIIYAAWKKVFEELYSVQISIGIGSVYAIDNLDKSFYEAMVSIEFNVIKNRFNVLQKFSDLGIFAEVFSKDLTKLNQLCTDTLKKILEHDYAFDSNLLITIRTLFDCNFNWRLASKKLFVHVNTLRYRYEKVEQLLDIDLSHPDTRTNLFVILRVSDILNKLDLVPSFYISDLPLTPSLKKQGKLVFSH